MTISMLSAPTMPSARKASPKEAMAQPRFGQKPQFGQNPQIDDSYTFKGGQPGRKVTIPEYDRSRVESKLSDLLGKLKDGSYTFTPQGKCKVHKHNGFSRGTVIFTPVNPEQSSIKSIELKLAGIAKFKFHIEFTMKDNSQYTFKTKMFYSNGVWRNLQTYLATNLRLREQELSEKKSGYNSTQFDSFNL